MPLLRCIVSAGDEVVVAFTEALDEISRYTDVRFEFDDPTIGGMRVAGVFRVDDLPGFIAALQVNLGVTATSKPDGTWLLSRPTTG